MVLTCLFQLKTKKKMTKASSSIQRKMHVLRADLNDQKQRLLDRKADIKTEMADVKRHVNPISLSL